MYSKDKSHYKNNLAFMDKMLSSKEQLSHAKTDAERTRQAAMFNGETLCNEATLR